MAIFIHPHKILLPVSLRLVEYSNPKYSCSGFTNSVFASLSILYIKNDLRKQFNSVIVEQNIITKLQRVNCFVRLLFV